jgi:mRNA interferase RelE/StbE
MGITCDVKIAPAAVKQLAKLPQQVQRKILNCLELLTDDPLPEGVEMLDNDPRLWRVCVGDYRVIYWFDEQTSLIVTLIVRHREEAYRDLEKLDPAILAKNLTPFLKGITALAS